jgi:hypothetical protein
MNTKTKNILMVSGVVVGGIISFIIYKKIKKKADVKTAVKSVTKGTNTTLGINIPSIANQIGIDLGTAYPVYDPRHWTENDTKVKELVLKVPKPLIKNLITEYYNKYKRNLQEDLQKLLDDYEGIKYLFE